MASYSSAVNSLRNHHEAAKPTTWIGYVYRFDAKAYDPAQTYPANAEVMYDGTHYKRVGSDTTVAGEFDPTKWTRAATGVAHKYQLIFVEDPSFEGDAETAGSVGKDGHPAYRIEVSVDAAGNKTYADPKALNAAVGGDYDGYSDDSGDGAFEIDGRLFSGLLSDNWSTGTKEEFDQLSIGNKRW